MEEQREKYINPFTDYGFKRLFGEEPIPEELRDGIFEKLFEVAEIAKFSAEEAQAYEDSLKSYRDLKNSLDTVFEEGIEKVAINGIKQRKSDELIMELTGLDLEQIKNLKEKLKNEG